MGFLVYDLPKKEASNFWRGLKYGFLIFLFLSFSFCYIIARCSYEYMSRHIDNIKLNPEKYSSQFLETLKGRLEYDLAEKILRKEIGACNTFNLWDWLDGTPYKIMVYYID